MGKIMKFLLDAGHSGVTFGHYWTSGKRSPQIPPGFYEGEFNRLVCDWAADGEDDILFLNPGPYPIPIAMRVELINKIVRMLKRRGERCILLSVHANAPVKPGWNRANGTTVFTLRKPHVESVRFSKMIVDEMRSQTPLRSRGIKKANFGILRVNCPSVLLECGFQTNKPDVDFLWTQKGYYNCGSAIWSAWGEYKNGVNNVE